MGKSSRRVEGLAGALFGRTQGKVLGILFGEPDRSFLGAEVIRRARAGVGGVHRELVKLERSGLVTVERSANQKRYRANRESPVFAELHGLVVKTVGLVGPLAEALAPLREKIRAAFVYGSVAGESDTAGSDVDLVVIGEGIDYPSLFEALLPAEAALGRPVHPKLSSPEEWRRRLSSGGAFARKVSARPRLFVVGRADDVD